MDNIYNTNPAIKTSTFGYAGDMLNDYKYDSRGRVLAADKYGSITRGVKGVTATADTFVDYMYEMDGRLYNASPNSSIDVYCYRYDANGFLSQVEKGSDTIRYIYDEDTVIGEISGSVTTLYIRFGNLLLGRYVYDSENETTPRKVELYGTDIGGSVHCMVTFTSGGAVTTPVYYDYTSGGERSIW